MDIQIIKLGSDVWWTSDGKINLAMLRPKALEMMQLASEGLESALVHSGSIKYEKIRRKDMRETKYIPVRDLVKYAGVGQGYLFSSAQQLFREIYSDASQHLVTYKEINDPFYRKHIRESIFNDLADCIMPAINYNDKIDFDEARKDNDKLAAEIAVLVGAKRLIILGNYEGFCQDPNNKNTLIEVVDGISKKHYSLCGQSSSDGTGGFETKLDAAKIATGQGIEVIIGNIAYELADLISGKAPRTYFVPKRL